MISLQDEISKFQKLVYNPQLAEFVTVDQMFVGGGITMESIINENNFIVEELKKMNAVFRNYCKLNEKVYSKITEHELSVHSEQARLNAVSSSIQRKLEDALKKIKQLYEDMLGQNQRNQTIIVECLDPLRKELGDKVDMATFKAQMKKVLEEYEEGGGQHQGEHGQGGQREGVEVLDSDRAPNSPYPKKKGKVSFDEFYRFRDQLDAKMKTSEEQLTSVDLNSSETKDLLMKYIPQINTLSHETQQNKKSIHNLGDFQVILSNELNQSISKLTSELNERLSDQVWSSKFEIFKEKSIKPMISKLEDSLKEVNTSLKANKEENASKFKQVDAEIMKNKNGIALASKDRQKIHNSLQRILKQMQTNKNHSDAECYKINKKLQTLSQQTTKSIVYLTKTTEQKVKDLNSQIQNLSKSIEDTVIKSVSKKFEVQLKAIDKDIRVNSQNIKSLNQDIGMVEEQIKHIKGLLAQKANFTDIVHHVERKADKEDIKELQFKFQETSQQFYSKQLNESINLSRLQKTQSASTKRVPSINKTSNSKSAMGPKTAHNIDSGTKLFMCGMEGHIDVRKNFSQHSTRRRNLKSSTVVVSDFLL